MEKDVVSRFLFEDLSIRGAFVQLDTVWQAMQTGRKYPYDVMKLLGETAATLILIADKLRQEGRVALQLAGSGPISLLFVDSDAALNIRGMARFKLPIEDSSMSYLIGRDDSYLQLVLDLPSQKEPYSSLVPLNGDNLTEVFEMYLTQSEQLPARFFLAVDQNRATGLVLQKMPNSDQQDVDGWNRITCLAETVTKQELLSLDAQMLLTRLFSEEKVRLFAGKKINYHCPYDREKATRILRQLGRVELESILADQGEVTINDEIGNHEYYFSREDLIALLMEVSSDSSTLH